ncbi:UNVERIFIED_CONTAM: putative amino acid permease 7 [Sesamum radiatum]|uniref:Amino acid permease 7 n=1 Tax=Sesamum radiatum TaxID=300843 RepID=A0AAW2LT77_SESRA
MAQLGWIAGPFLMLFFAFITLISTFLLCDCYRSPDPEYGPIRNRSYTDAVRLYLGKDYYSFCQFLSLIGPFTLVEESVTLNLEIFGTVGERSAWICELVMQISFYGTGIAYVITSATCLRAIERSNCYHKHGHDASCEFGDTFYMLLFGVVQVFMSLIPDFHSMDWLSVVAAIMSFTYSSIGLGLGAAKVIGDGVVQGSIDGLPASSRTQKLWLVSQALGDIAFAYPYSMIVLNIQDTLRSPPPEKETMKQASVVSVCITTFFYLSCGGFGYAAFGDQTPGNLLTGFGFYEPYWLIDFANACIVLHLVGGYQVYSQPVFAVADKWFAEQLPDSAFVHKHYTLKLPFLPALEMNLQSGNVAETEKHQGLDTHLDSSQEFQHSLLRSNHVCFGRLDSRPCGCPVQLGKK